MGITVKVMPGVFNSAQRVAEHSGPVPADRAVSSHERPVSRVQRRTGQDSRHLQDVSISPISDRFRKSEMGRAFFVEARDFSGVICVTLRLSGGYGGRSPHARPLLPTSIQNGCTNAASDWACAASFGAPRKRGAERRWPPSRSPSPSLSYPLPAARPRPARGASSRHQVQGAG